MSNEFKRIFVGIPLSEEIKERILEWENKIQDPSTKNQFRWIAGRNLHITLLPPWEAGELEIVEIIRKLKAQPTVEPFIVGFNKIEFGPNMREPRMIWATGKPVEEVKKLKKLIEISLGKKPEERPFRLHATLARIKLSNPSLGPSPSFGEGNINWNMLVDRFVLYESKLLPQGAEYEVIEDFRF